jgi:DNA-binding transcriptional ArsR family regulator
VRDSRTVTDIEGANFRREWRKKILSPSGPADAGAKLTALGLEHYMNSATLSTWASAPTIAKATSQSERTVRNHLAALTRGGFIKELKRARGRSTVYQLVQFWTPEDSSGVVRTPRKSTAGTPEKNSTNPGNGFRRTSYVPVYVPGRDTHRKIRSKGEDGGEALSPQELERRKAEQLDRIRAKGIAI